MLPAMGSFIIYIGMFDKHLLFSRHQIIAGIKMLKKSGMEISGIRFILCA